MKIAQIAPIVERVPPKRYGGTERVVSALTEELVRRGHEVTLFATGDSQTSAKLISVFPRGSREARVKDHYLWTLLHIATAYNQRQEFDIIHDHNAPFSLPVGHLSGMPVLTTMHGAFTRENLRLFQVCNVPYVATISKAQLYPASGINHAGTVYNGLPMDEYPFSNVPGDYLLYVGRISMEKGVHLAIDAAQIVDMPLIIAAKLDDVDRPYYREYIEPQLSDRIRWIGEVNEEERNDLMTKAYCFLHPVIWREPFGLTLIEAAACGCPVVALNHGSIPEIIRPGVTGFIADDLEGLVESIGKIDSIDRNDCRAHVLSHFSAKHMADGYEELYKQIIGKRP